MILPLHYYSDCSVIVSNMWDRSFRWHISTNRAVARKSEVVAQICCHTFERRLHAAHSASNPIPLQKLLNIKWACEIPSFLRYVFDLWPWPLTLTGNVTMKNQSWTHLGSICEVWWFKLKKCRIRSFFVNFRNLNPAVTLTFDLSRSPWNRLLCRASLDLLF